MFTQAKENVQPILPPPPSSTKRGHFERQQTVQATTSSGTTSPAANQVASKTPPSPDSAHWFDKETEDLFSDGELSKLSRKDSLNDRDKDGVSLNV